MSWYEDWIRRRTDPNTPPDRRQNALARKVLGELMEGIRRGGLFQNKLVRRFPDGTVVTAQFDGTTPIVMVQAPQEAEPECECIGLAGAISKGRTITDWPAGASDPGVTPALYLWFVGSWLEDVYLWHTIGEGGRYRLDVGGAKMVLVDMITPTSLGLGEFSDQSGVMAIYHTDQFGPAMHLTSEQFGFVAGNAVQSIWTVVSLDLSLKQQLAFNFSDTFRNYLWVSPLRRGRSPTVLNCGRKATWSPSRTWPQVYQFRDPTTTKMTDAIAVTTTLTNGKTFSLNNPVAFSMQGAADSEVAVVADDGPDVVFVGMRQDTANAALADDIYRVDLQAQKVTVSHLGVPLYPHPNLTAQICDTFLIAGGTEADGTLSGDVWLWQVGGAARKIGNIPELASLYAQTGFAYAIATAHAVHILAPVMGTNTNGDAVPVGYRLYSVT